MQLTLVPIHHLREDPQTDLDLLTVPQQFGWPESVSGEVFVADEERGEDATHQYLDEIGHLHLLSQQEEQYLFACMARGRVHNQDAEICAQGQAARERLIASNLRLVVSIAKRYSGKMALLDLIQEGNIGLMEAVERFDLTLGYKFSTYATWWIRQTITCALTTQARTVRLPQHVHEKLARLQRVRQDLTSEWGGAPTVAELAAHLKMPLATVQMMIEVQQEVISLDLPLASTEEAHTLSELIPDPQQENLEEMVCRLLQHEEIRRALTQLTPREQHIIALRYGLEDGTSRTLAIVGLAVGVTRERIRQIERKALRKLGVILTQENALFML